MLKTKLLHPEILDVLGRCGHFARILIADGNFSFATKPLPGARRVYLNLMPGVPTVTQVLEALVETIPFQAALAVAPPEEHFRAVHAEYRKLLPPEIAWSEKDRDSFYLEVQSPDTALVIATGDTRRFANLLLTVGVVKFP